MPNTAGGIKIGMIKKWSGSIASIPAGFLLCNGQTVNGVTPPNLRDKFVIGAGSVYAVGDTGGATEHIHSVDFVVNAALASGTAIINSAPAGNLTVSGTTNRVGELTASKSHYSPYYSTAFIYSVVTGGIPNDAIVMWSGLIADIPTGWKLCDGTNGTIDLRDNFVVGSGSTYNPGNTGGGKSHNHTKAVNGPVALGAGVVILDRGGGTYTNFIIWNGILTLGIALNLPPYFALAFIQNKSGGTLGSYTNFVTLWSGSVASIPPGWVIHSSLIDRFVVGAKQDSGGVAKTNVSGSLTQTGGYTDQTLANGTGHSNSLSITGGSLDYQMVAPIIAAGGGSFGVNCTGGGGGAPQIASNMPLYYALAYVIKQ